MHSSSAPQMRLQRCVGPCARELWAIWSSLFSATLLERLDRYARYRHVLQGKRGMRQDKIDQALSILHGVAPVMSPSSSSTEQLLLDALGAGELSAAEAAEIAGVSRPTAQRRLATMASQGIVQIRLRYGAAGRPEHLYSKMD